MSLQPMGLMLERVKRARADSDTAFFHDLLYAGEFLVRLTTSAVVAAIDDDRDRHRYRLVHSLVRADGIGEWIRVLDLLGIGDMVTEEYRAQVIDESDGHPYVIKILLGEVADARRLSRPKQMLSRKDDMLDALFERTFSNLTPLAARAFLTLSAWRSLVPQLALEAVLLRDQSDQLDTAGAVDELVRMSVVERVLASDGSEFLDVPLTAAIFGNRKLSVSPQKLVIENDVKLLHDLGSATASTLKEGIYPRIRSLFERIAARISEGKLEFSNVQKVLEFIALGYPPAWILLADLYEELHGLDEEQVVAEYVRRYVENSTDERQTRAAWERLSSIYRRSGNVVGACGAFVRAFSAQDAPLSEISNMANWVNNNRTAIVGMDVTDQRAVFGSLASLMEQKIGESSARDLSRLAWLHLHAGNAERALGVAELGLEKEPGNEHCERLVERLAITMSV